ncbi:tyrosine-type recombinase/integrase [Halobaculum roseum]|uniref:Tyrosine-type recombinase/integrase n=1 Tax=Halobaculum roseum TaxID=2175149 RepID=A0ABD5MRE4_9EURY|nr:tyrosine-type recombinase/integrase [Halobaculum roseum]QZY01235.1 tyrosine-type recombinase/integrase [Halobaculum roseum]
MAEATDPSGSVKKKNRAEKNLRESDGVDERDRKAILALYGMREASGDFEPSTQANLLTNLRRACELAEKPVVDWEHSEYGSDHTDFVLGLQNGTLDGAPAGGYSESYVGNIKRCLSIYLNHLGKEWNEDIRVGQPSDGKITEADCFTASETSRLIGVSNTRDSAMWAMWLATGQRRSAMGSVLCKDVKIEGNSGGFHLNPEAIGLKGAEGYRPLLWATPYVARWINEHPTWPEDPEAALFVCQRSGNGYDLGDALGVSGITKALKRAGDRAGIDKHKQKTHRLRHTAIRRMIRDGLSDQWIKYMVGWGEDSPQLARYGSLSDESKARDIELHYGIEEEADEEKHLFENCPACDTPISDLTGASFCPSCGLALKHDSDQMERVAESRLWDSRGEGSPSEDKGVNVAKEVLENPGAKEAVLSELKDELMADVKEELDL